MNLVWLKLIKRILTHKYYVAKYCFQIGLYWQGITHDLSKFSFTEFSRAIKYWDDKMSSLANECRILGYSQTFLHHRGRNPHHYEYWIHSLDNGGIPAKMPKKYVLELICDYLAAAKTYGDEPINLVANLFGEYSFTESIAPYENRHTDYDALKKALLDLKDFCKDNEITEISIPYKLGCGLAGGDWDGVVYPMLQELFANDLTITLYIYKLCNN